MAQAYVDYLKEELSKGDGQSVLLQWDLSPADVTKLADLTVQYGRTVFDEVGHCTNAD